MMEASGAPLELGIAFARMYLDLVVDTCNR
jgi:hypothetical protein